MNIENRINRLEDIVKGKEKAIVSPWFVDEKGEIAVAIYRTKRELIEAMKWEKA